MFSPRAALFFLFLAVIPQWIYSQENPAEDSLYAIINKTHNDSAKAVLHNSVAESWLKKDDYKAIAEARKSLVFSRMSNQRSSEAYAYYIIGAAYDNLERYPDALEYYFYSLPITEEINDTNLLLRNYNQIGIIYSYQSNHESALKYFDLFTKLSEDLNILKNMARGYNNLGICYKNLQDYETASNYYYKALQIFQEENFSTGVISSYMNLGVCAASQGDNDKALEFYQKAIDLSRKENNLYALGIAKVNLGEVYFVKEQYRNAITEYDSALAISVTLDIKRQMKDAYDGLYKTYEKLGDYKNAYQYLRKYLATKDTIFSDETKEKLSLAEKNYQAIKAEKQFELKQKQDEIQMLKQDQVIAANRFFIWIMIFISLIVVICAVVLLLRFVEKKKANTLLQQQRDEIAHQKKEITDSITYAKRIQSAILPPAHILEKFSSEYFILHKPKDIVSGDFYWFTEYDNKLIFAVADCTGHGVPGALVSMICSTALSRSVLEFNLTSPGKILDKTSELVTDAFSLNENIVRDGMDISIGTYDPSTKKLLWSGANNPIYIIRNNHLLEFKPDKQPIGKFEGRKPFTTHDLDLQKNDVLYLFSDGFADQFGMAKESWDNFNAASPNQEMLLKLKKFKYSNFKNLLLRISVEEAAKQKHAAEKYFSEWKGNAEQTDDVCLLGLRIN